MADQALFNRERLMSHMHYLCKEIGPRPPTSAQERQAAAYVREQLAGLGITAVQEQPFMSRRSIAWVNIPYFVALLLAYGLALAGGLLGKLVGGLGLLGLAEDLRRFSKAHPPLMDPLLPKSASQNIIAHIPPTGQPQRRLYLIGHLDTNQQLMLAPPDDPRLLKPLGAAVTVLNLVAGLAFIVDALRGKKEAGLWQKLPALFTLLSLPMMIREASQPYIEGANDNATAVTTLLAIAEALQSQPLKNTEVVLLFTGCEEVVCTGIEAYLNSQPLDAANSYWIDLEMVGTGDLCYVTRHGINFLAEYEPHPEMVALAARAAAKHPELRVIGKDMTIVEEVGNLRRRDYKAICIAGYGPDGFLPNWHRLSDNLDNIEPETLQRAVNYTWALVHEVDAL